GEILSNLTQHLAKVLDNGSAEVSPRKHPYAVVLSQTCDLDWDFKKATTEDAGCPFLDLMGQQLPSILFCELVTASELKSRDLKSDVWKRVRQNKDERYQFLEVAPKDADLLRQGLPETGMDFKRYFTIPTGEVYRAVGSGTTQRRSVLSNPYAEHLASRFFYFQSRIALPREHDSEPMS
ncbi:MAG: hypothetical protein M3Y56_12200, partial [Armatimonadota bacterium]|nr:hypothetical protein [Armatimonadota bacterium]